MKFELKDFQEEAARKLVDDMTYLMDGYERRNKIGSCCLSAPTGAGKTVRTMYAGTAAFAHSIQTVKRGTTRKIHKDAAAEIMRHGHDGQRLLTHI